MTIYYVKPSGDDTDTGLSEENAFATVTKGMQTASSAGDIVYIAPGTYREILAMLYSGALGNPISFIGDTECHYFTDENPGYIRITGCDADETPSYSTGSYPTIIACNSKNYLVFENIVVDGTATGIVNGRGIHLLGTGNICNNCIAIVALYGFYGTATSTCTNCFSTSLYPFITGTCRECVAVGGNSGIYRATAYNCISIGAVAGGYESVLHNCTIIGSYYGSRVTTAGNSQTLNNCLFISCYLSIYGDSTNTTINKCTSFCSSYAAYGTSTIDLLPIDEITSVYDYNIGRASYTTGTATIGKHMGYVDTLKLVEKIASAFRFNLNYQTNDGDDTLVVGDYDILGHPRRLGDGTIDTGAIEFTKKEPEWTNYKTTMPAIKISRKGMETIQFPVKAGVPKTITAWTKFFLDGGTDKPQLIATATGDTDTATAIGGSATYYESPNDINTLALYHFNNGVWTDYSGNGYTLIPGASSDGSGTPTLGDRGAIFVKANGHKATNADLNLYGQDEITIEAWINLATLPSAAPNNVYYITTQHWNAYLYLDFSSPDIRLNGYVRQNGPTIQGVAVTITPTVNTWHHVALTYSRSNYVRLWLDGSLVGEDTSVLNDSLHYNVNGAAVGIHSATDLLEYCFDGIIDEVRYSDIIRYTDTFTPERLDYEDWERLSVTITPTVDTTAKIQLYSRETGAYANTIFSDISVS